jgi:hypothetical protein
VFPLSIIHLISRFWKLSSNASIHLMSLSLQPDIPEPWSVHLLILTVNEASREGGPSIVNLFGNKVANNIKSLKDWHDVNMEGINLSQWLNFWSVWGAFSSTSEAKLSKHQLTSEEIMRNYRINCQKSVTTSSYWK